MKKKRILITNDDGISAPSLDILRERLSKLGDVFISAPEFPMNAMGNSITLHKPVRVREVSEGKYAVSGTPADSARVGILTILEDKTDLLVSGINLGPNLGDDVNYSGTVAGAREAAMLGIPALAVSLAGYEHLDFERAADITLRVAEEIMEKGLPPRTLLNLNIPDTSAPINGIKICKLGIRIYERVVRERVDPSGKKYYWIIGEKLDGYADEGTDFEAINGGYASLTPLGLNYTDEKLSGELQNWNLNL